MAGIALLSLMRGGSGGDVTRDGWALRLAFQGQQVVIVPQNLSPFGSRFPYICGHESHPFRTPVVQR